MKRFSIIYITCASGGFASREKLYKQAKKEIADLTREEVCEWLKGQITYTLHAPARKRFARNRIIVARIDDQWEADLVDMQEFSSRNCGYKYILTVIDCFSKYAWVRPLKSKTGIAVRDALVSIFSGRKPAALRTDKGKEFINKPVQDLLKNNNIRYYTANNSEIKCSIVERFNRTFKSRMYRYFTARGTRKFTNVLDELVHGYNQSFHRSIRMAPIDVNEENSNKVFKNLYGYDSLRELYMAQKRPSKLASGDDVRIKYKLGPFDKGFYPNWSDQVYKVSSIDAAQNLPVFTIDGVTEKNVDNRKFYSNELQKVIADVHRVEKILKRRVYKGEAQYFVKWLGYPSSCNSWINSKDITLL